MLKGHTNVNYFIMLPEHEELTRCTLVSLWAWETATMDVGFLNHSIRNVNVQCAPQLPAAACAETGLLGHSAAHPEPTSALFPVPVLQTCCLPSGASSSQVPRSLLHTGQRASLQGLRCLSLHPVPACGHVIHPNLASCPKDPPLWPGCSPRRPGVHIPGTAQGNANLSYALNVSALDMGV